MNPHRHFQGAAAWLLRSLLVLLSGNASVFGEPSGDRWPGGEKPEVVHDTGYALGKVIPLHEIPRRLEFEAGNVSLVPDPDDHRGDSIVVYLVNDTDEPRRGVIGGQEEVRSEVKIDGHWFNRDQGRGIRAFLPEPLDLPPRHALILAGPHHGHGDTAGSVRYTFGPDGVVSGEIPGRYAAGFLRDAVCVMTRSVPLEEGLRLGLMLGQWEASPVAKDPAELVALLELEWHRELCLLAREQMGHWLPRKRRNPDLTEDEAAAVAVMGTILTKPWVNHRNHEGVLHRCAEALEGDARAGYGTPESQPSLVWRYLSHPGAPVPEKASQETRSRLARLAAAEWGRNDPRHRREVAGFLSRSIIREEDFPAHRLHEFLRSGDRRIELEGLEGLALRGREQEVLQWTLSKPPGSRELWEDYSIVRERLRGPISEAEAAVLERLIASRGVQAFQLMTVYQRQDSPSLPPRCIAALRKILQRELEPARRAWWESLAGQVDFGRSVPHWRRGLADGIRLLDASDDPADTGLLVSFLDHPAGGRSQGDRPQRYFDAREAALNALRGRNVPLRELVLRMDIPPESRSLWSRIGPVRISLAAVGAACLAALMGSVVLRKQ